MKFHLRTCVLGLLLVISAIFVEDVEGANVNDNGNITYEALPEGSPYSSPSTFDEGSFPLPTTWTFIGSFLQTVSPGSPPYDLINSLLAGGSGFNINLLTDNVLVYQENLLGFAICCAIGLLFCLIFPIVALCFCCCRCCCNNCGGKMHMEQKDNSCCKVMVFSLFLLASLVFVFAGAVTALCISGYTGQQAQQLPTTVDNTFNDLITYVNNTLEEIDFVINDQLSFTLTQVRNDLRDIGTFVGEPVRESLRTNVQPAIDSVIGLETNVNFTLSTLETIDARQNTMETQWNTLDTNLTDILGRLNTFCMSCGGCCDGVDITVTIDADYRDYDFSGGMVTGSYPQPAVNESIVALQDVADADLSSSAQEGAQTFEDIPETLTNTTQSDVDSIIDTIDTLEGTVQNLINQTTSQLDSLSGNVEPFRNDASFYLREYAMNYDQYRAIVMYVFYGFILFIVALFTVGLICGLCGYDRRASPVNRSSTSHCGGQFLMAGSGFVLIFGTLFMLITALTFVVGGPLDRLFCAPVTSGELFAETIDKEDAIIDGYYLGNALFQNPNIPLTITGILNACENNVGVYSAFQLENVFNASAFTDISGHLPNVDDQFSNITGDFATVNILTSETKGILVDFRDSPADDILWTNFTMELGKNLTLHNGTNANSFTQLITDLQTAAAATSGSDQTDLNAFATELSDLQTSTLNPLLVHKDLILNEIDQFTNYTDTIDTQVNATIANAEAAQNYIDNNVESLVQSSISSYSDRILGYPDQYVLYAGNQVENQVGGCMPIYNLWNQGINTICVGILRSFNGLWFTLGWSVFFFMPALIFGVKLAKHFRRMETTDGYGDNDDFEMQSGQQHYSGNKVAPAYDAGYDTKIGNTQFAHHY